ncbi:hypothetical protein [Calothrix rhizosoleniae]|uniref:hypothetical protein n=1 Tax=Calothrix rhizosoleniae TaxID=888997 RepID=UPI00190EBA09|nr:hypothetical protein [Calothrix rhizosoleniae]
MKTSTFNLIFSTVVGLTLLSGSTSVLLACQPDLSESQKRILENTSNTWLMGTGAIFGLLGGRTILPTGVKMSGEQNEDKEKY